MHICMHICCCIVVRTCTYVLRQPDRSRELKNQSEQQDYRGRDARRAVMWIAKKSPPSDYKAHVSNVILNINNKCGLIIYKFKLFPIVLFIIGV